jgi:hypothetical protein
MKKEKVLIGWGSRDVTPEGKVSLRGQFHVRISDEVRDPLTTTALAIESEESKEQSIIVSLDAVGIADEVWASCRKVLAEKLNDFDSDKLVISATHTHTAPEQPAFILGPSRNLGEDIMTQKEYGDLLVEKISEAAIEAWKSRKLGALSWGKGHAVIGFNRRTSYFDGSTAMYGLTDKPDFSHIEGHEDHGVDMLFTYDTEHKLTGMIVNVPCPSQCTESAYFVSADFWHETREEICKRNGEEIFILAQCSAAGDLSPRPMVNREADRRMLELKGYGEEYNLARRQDIADKLASVIDEVLPLVAKDIRDEIEFGHDVIKLDLPERTATEDDLNIATSEVAQWQARLEELKDADPTSHDFSFANRRFYFNQKVIDMYKRQHEGKDTMPAELHALRIGDVAMCTNRFEYYLDFGERIKARSKALQTFVVQLAGKGTYLPTERSLKGGSYGAYIASTPIGPEGGQQIVEASISKINEMFGEEI